MAFSLATLFTMLASAVRIAAAEALAAIPDGLPGLLFILRS